MLHCMGAIKSVTMATYVYGCIQRKYQEAKLNMTDRLVRVNNVIQSLENDLELLCATGVEDQLQVLHYANHSGKLSSVSLNDIIYRWTLGQLWSYSEMLELRYIVIIITV